MTHESEPSGTKARPLIVVGMGRSGTRMCANILANSLDVELQGELGGQSGAALLGWLEAVRTERGEAAGDGYALAREAFRIAAPGRTYVRDTARWFGHKTPRHERHFRQYERLFGQPGREAVYVYCIRNPFDVWRSYRAMPWNGFATVDGFVDAWTRSARQYEAMCATVPGRVLTFNLDAMLAATDWVGYVDTELLRPLALDQASFRKPVGSLENTNSAERKIGVRPASLPQAEQDTISAHPDVQALWRRHFPWMPLETPPSGLRWRIAARRLLRAGLRPVADRSDLKPAPRRST